MQVKDFCLEINKANISQLLNMVQHGQIGLKNITIHLIKTLQKYQSITIKWFFNVGYSIFRQTIAIPMIHA